MKLCIASFIIYFGDIRREKNVMRKVGVLFFLFIFLTLISAKPGDYNNLGGGWTEIGGMASLGDKLYIISGGKLYETTKDGKYKSLGGGWIEICGMTSLGDKLYIISGGNLYETTKTVNTSLSAEVG